MKKEIEQIIIDEVKEDYPDTRNIVGYDTASEKIMALLYPIQKELEDCEANITDYCTDRISKCNCTDEEHELRVKMYNIKKELEAIIDKLN